MRVLITGAAGRIGGYLRTSLVRPDRTLRLLDVVSIDAGEREEIVQASVTDMDVLTEACRGMDAVIHLAGISGETGWDEIRKNNIEGTYNAVEAARRAGVDRFVFASSVHAVGFHRREGNDAPVPDYLFPAPDTFYGLSKSFGEALTALYHHRYGMDAICLRIAECRDRPISPWGLANWLSPDDAGRLFEAALSAPGAGYRVVWGVSANTRSPYSQEEAAAIGYHPQDDSEMYAEGVLARHGSDKGATAAVDPFLGGDFTTDRFDADRLKRGGEPGRLRRLRARLGWRAWPRVRG